MPNFVAIDQTAAAKWRFFDLSKMAAVCHLRFGMRVYGVWTGVGGHLVSSER